MGYKFENLEIWKDARTLAKEVYFRSKSFPSVERFGITDQIRRAVSSVVLNISEGSMKQSDKEFIRYLRISQGSICEVVTALYISLDQQYISENDFQDLYKFCNKLSARVGATINSLARKG